MISSKLISQNSYPKFEHFDWLIAKLVFILANQNAQISEISFYEVNLEIILPLIYLPRLRTYVLCPLRLLFFANECNTSYRKNFHRDKRSNEEDWFFLSLLGHFLSHWSTVRMILLYAPLELWKKKSWRKKFNLYCVKVK